MQKNRSKDFDFDHEALLLVGYLERNHGTFQILLLIHQDGSASTSEMRCMLKPGQEAIDNALSGLAEAGLIGCEKCRNVSVLQYVPTDPIGESFSRDAPLVLAPDLGDSRL
jgi:hypothetical protein